MLENSKLRFIRYAKISVLLLIMISAVNLSSFGSRAYFPSIEEIIYESDCIVHGRVVDAYMGDPPHRWVYYKVEIYEIIYDDKETNIIESGETGHVTFAIPGGDLRGVPREKLKPERGVVSSNPDMPGFNIGEELILFLREYIAPDNTMLISIVNRADGFMKVEEKDGGKMLTTVYIKFKPEGVIQRYIENTPVKPEEFIKQIKENIEKIKSNPEYDFEKRIEREEREKKDNRDKASYPPSSRNNNPMGPPFPLKPGDENKKIIIKSTNYPPPHTHTQRETMRNMFSHIISSIR